MNAIINSSSMPKLIGKTLKSKLFIIVIIAMAVFACKKSNDSTVNHTKYLNKDQTYNELRNFIIQDKKQQLSAYTNSTTTTSTIVDDNLKSYISNKYGKSYINKVYQPIKNKILAINLAFPVSHSAKSLHLNSIHTISESSAAPVLDTMDVAVINNTFSNSVLQQMDVSPKLTSTIQSLNDNINTLAQNYLQNISVTDTTSAYSGTADFMSSVSNTVLQQANTINYSLTDADQLAYSVALLSLNDQLVNTLAPQLEQTIRTNIRAYNNQSKIQAYGAYNNQSKIHAHTYGLFSWVKKNVLAPVVTFVVKTSVFVAAIAGAIVVAGATTIFGDYSITVGAIAGLGLFSAVSNAVNKWLYNAGLYDKGADIAHYAYINLKLIKCKTLNC